MTNQEIWKPVVGYEGTYEVSNIGRVKRVKGTIITKHGIVRSWKEKVLSNSNCIGYKVVTMNKNGGKTLRVHRLVAMAFIENPHNKDQVNHINGIKHDNRVENLEWCNQSENILHAYKTGLMKCNYSGLGKLGKDNSNSKIILQYDLNGNFIQEIHGASEAARIVGFDMSGIARAARGAQDTAAGFKWKYK